MKYILAFVLILFVNIAHSYSNPYVFGILSSVTTIFDDFSGTLSNWTNPLGTGRAFTLDDINDNLYSQSDSGVILHNTKLDTVSQYVSAKIVNIANYNGFLLRNDGTTNNYSYGVRLNSSTKVIFRSCNGTDQATCSDESSEIVIPTVSNNDFIGFTISGTGDSTVVKYYRWSGSSYSSVPAIGDWTTDNTDEYTISDGDITDARFADTGKYVGFYNGSVFQLTWDDFKAGTF